MYNVYLICSKLGDEKLYKIGYTRRNINQRIKELKVGNAGDFYLIDSYESIWGSKIEASLHKILRLKKISGEWFDLDEIEVSNFKKICEKLDSNFETISKTLLYKENKNIL